MKTACKNGKEGFPKIHRKLDQEPKEAVPGKEEALPGKAEASVSLSEQVQRREASSLTDACFPPS